MMKNDLLDVKRENQKFYGIYRGVVEDNNPKNDAGKELQDGRIKVRIWGLHTKVLDDIPTEDLPLAQPAYPNVIGSITGKGMWSVPVQGTHVFVFFENGDHMQPRYFATAPGIEPTEGEFDRDMAIIEGFRDPDKTYPLHALMEEPDMNRLMRDSDGVYSSSLDNTAWANIKSAQMSGACNSRGTFNPGNHDIDNGYYPSNFVIETRTGQTLEMNDNVTVLYHNASSYLTLNGSGMALKGGLTTDGSILCAGLTSLGSSILDGGSHEILATTSVLAGGCSGHLPLIKCSSSAGAPSFIDTLKDWLDGHTHSGNNTEGKFNGMDFSTYAASVGITLSSMCTTILKGS